MEKKNLNIGNYLNVMKEQIDSLIEESKSLNEKDTFLKALKHIVDLKLNVEEITRGLDDFEDQVIALSHLDFRKRVKEDSRKHLFSLIASSMNMLGEELEAKATKKLYLKEAIDLATDSIIIITNSDFIVESANTKFYKHLGYSNESANNQSIIQYFALKTFFHKLREDSEIILNSDIHLIDNYNNFVSIKLNVKPIMDNNNSLEGFLFKAVIL